MKNRQLIGPARQIHRVPLGNLKIDPLKSRLTFQEFLTIDPPFAKFNRSERPISRLEFRAFRRHRLWFVESAAFECIGLRVMLRIDARPCPESRETPLRLWRSSILTSENEGAPRGSSLPTIHLSLNSTFACGIRGALITLIPSAWYDQVKHGHTIFIFFR